MPRYSFTPLRTTPRTWPWGVLITAVRPGGMASAAGWLAARAGKPRRSTTPDTNKGQDEGTARLSNFNVEKLPAWLKSSTTAAM
jgi:hypothetical protein